MAIQSSSDRGFLVPVVIAFVVLAILGAAVFLLNPHKTAEFSVTKVDLFAPHTEFNAVPGSTHIIGEAPATEDDLYVVAHVRLTDKLRLPLFLSAWTATATLADGSSADATIVPASQLSRLGQSFPALPGLITQPAFRFNDEIAPGSTAEGTLIFLFPNLTQAAWQSKKSAELTLQLRNQNALTAKLP
ncbi:MAG TPA: hypothetical protein VM865_05940 [Acidobacteriaceae bacterium]|jgi:hypothetical protein|nr:hypothetical protein [Acidobacteriaceae bacterium]